MHCGVVRFYEASGPIFLAAPPSDWCGKLGLFVLPRSSRVVNYAMVTLPSWLIFLSAVIPTAILWYRDRQTVKPGCCLTCGYDLRASKGNCPECGTTIA